MIRGSGESECAGISRPLQRQRLCFLVLPILSVLERIFQSVRLDLQPIPDRLHFHSARCLSLLLWLQVCFYWGVCRHFSISGSLLDYCRSTASATSAYRFDPTSSYGRSWVSRRRPNWTGPSDFRRRRIGTR